VAALATKLGLDRPAPSATGLGHGLLHGDLGDSYAYSTPVSELVLERWPSPCRWPDGHGLTTVLALARGIYAAARHNKLGDVG
jgi:peptide/nickel transport system permease protein